MKVPNSMCINGSCQCKSNFVQIRRDKCLAPAKMDDYCLKDEQCTLGGKYTRCKFIIPRVYGKCRCPLGYVVTDDKQCLPSIGSKCELNSECSKITPNSICSKTTGQCECDVDYKASDDRSKCELIFKPSETPNDIIEEDSSSALDLGPVSLGKRCRSSIECQIRDPYSACINGICECLSRTSKCNSFNPGCHNDTFQCRSGQCISWYFVCDKTKNCEDGSDEDECEPFKCPREAFQCDDGSCLSRSAVCNGRWECPDGSDEARCYKGIPCDKKSFRCKSGQCLPQYTFCNAVTDCLDGSDEIQSVCEYSTKCPKGMFQCENKKCRSTAILCSGVDGCGDNSDEERCEVCYCEKPPNY
uniref:EB domain-containing protein n=2 Tax=Tetranychus urticae TaxID=32264 RepID=T1KMZ1_TETUR